MKRPLYFFYLVVFMGLMALIRPVAVDTNIDKIATAQAQIEQTAGSE